MRLSIVLVALLGCTPATIRPSDAEANENPIELGDVSWGRDLDAAKAASKTSGKPVFILFNEVPGCNTVRGFGKTALKDPIVVEAIETLFEPVVVYNNVGGKDREILNAYNEPTWNNPIVRIYDSKHKELTKRFNGPYKTKALVNTMIDALNKAGRDVPTFLSNYQHELSGLPKKAVFSMYCFWSGESKLAQLPGVISTSPGFLKGREVVEVTYDASKTSYADLVGAAKKSGAADGVIASDDAEQRIASRSFPNAIVAKKSMRFSKKDDKYYLARSKYRSLSLTPYQATMVNSAVSRNRSPDRFLSPRQVASVK